MVVALQSAPVVAQRFPVLGPVDYGEADARCGALAQRPRARGPGRVRAGGHAARGAALRRRRRDAATTAGAATTSPSTRPRSARPTSTCTCCGRPPSASGRARSPGARIGRVGCTGSCWGDHLHLELRRGRGTLGRGARPAPAAAQARRQVASRGRGPEGAQEPARARHLDVARGDRRTASEDAPGRSGGAAAAVRAASSSTCSAARRPRRTRARSPTRPGTSCTIVRMTIASSSRWWSAMRHWPGSRPAAAAAKPTRR